MRGCQKNLRLTNFQRDKAALSPARTVPKVFKTIGACTNLVVFFSSSLSFLSLRRFGT